MEILSQCPKPKKPGDETPPCPEYEQAAAKNRAIDASSMTCNKYGNGQYIPFFRESKGDPKKPGKIKVSWERDADCTTLEALLFDNQGKLVNDNAAISSGYTNRYSKDGQCVAVESLPSNIIGDTAFSVKAGQYQLRIYYRVSGNGTLGGWKRHPSYDTEIVVKGGDTTTVPAPNQGIDFRYNGKEKVTDWVISVIDVNGIDFSHDAWFAARPWGGINTIIRWAPIAPGTYTFEFSNDELSRSTPITKTVTVEPGQSLTIDWP
jgi:hypothetical protein